MRAAAFGGRSEPSRVENGGLVWPANDDDCRGLIGLDQLDGELSTAVIWPVASSVILLMGLDSFVVGIKALSWWLQTPARGRFCCV